MNILVTLNSGYLKQLCIMLTSLCSSNPNENFDVYIVHSDLTPENFEFLQQQAFCNQCKIINTKIDNSLLKDAPVSERFPIEMYYRIFAPSYLPQEMDRILYLDPDLVVINPIDKLYNIEFGSNLMAAASHIKNKTLRKFNQKRLALNSTKTYFNSGVLLMNLALLRKVQDPQEIYSYIRHKRNRLFLPDQDVINGVYGNRIIELDSLIYNLSEKYLTHHNLNLKNKHKRVNLMWVKNNSVVVHYCGRNKPWKASYRGKLGAFYNKYAALERKQLSDIKE